MNIPGQRVELADKKLIEQVGSRFVTRTVWAARTTDVITSTWYYPPDILRQWMGIIKVANYKVPVWAYHLEGENFDSRQPEKWHIWSDDTG